MNVLDDDEDARTLLRPPTPALIDENERGDVDSDTEDELRGVVPARALLDACAKERERLLPESVRRNRLENIGSVLMRLVAFESRLAKENLSTGFTLRVYSNGSTLYLSKNVPVTFKDGYKTMLSVHDLVGWLREQPSLAGYRVETTLVGISFQAINDRHTAY